MPPPRALAHTPTGEKKLIREIREEFEAWVQQRGHKNPKGEVVWSERMIAEAGTMGVATLMYLTRRGDRESARWLAEKFLGAPEQPYQVRIQNLSVDESLEYLRREMIAELGLSPESAAALVARVEEVSALPAPRVEEDDDADLPPEV